MFLLQVTITGKLSDPDTAALVSVVRSRFIPGRVFMLADGNTSSVLYRNCEAMRRMRPTRQAAYVCRQRTCTLPVHTPQDLASLLDSSM